MGEFNYVLTQGQVGQIQLAYGDLQARLARKESEFLVLQKALEMLLNKVNAVTSWHRHGNTIDPAALDALSNRQIEVEEILNGKN